MEIAHYLQAEISKDPVTLGAFQGVDLSPGAIFQNDDSLRLRPRGHQMLKVLFENYTFEMERRLNAGEIITLSRHMNGPFYIVNNKFTVYSNQHIVMFKIAGGVTSWLETFS